MDKNKLKNPAFIFFLVAILATINLVIFSNIEYWFTFENIFKFVIIVVRISVYFFIPSMVLYIIQLLKKYIKNKIIQTILKVVNILVIICSTLLFLLWEYFHMRLYFAFL